MVETTTNISKFRQKRLKGLAVKSKSADSAPVGSYLYPKNELYTREEFELLDTIYSDEPSAFEQKEIKPEIKVTENFWPENRDQYLNTANPKNNIFSNVLWFLGGIAITSVIWLIYFQVNVNEIRTKSDTQIVFQKSANIMTDKTVDKEVTKQLKDRKAVVQALQKENPVSKFFGNLFSPKGNTGAKPVVAASSAPVKMDTVRFHIVGSGDSLWIIANKYYSNPSPDNISKIMKANNMKRVGMLSIGQKLVIPQ